ARPNAFRDDALRQTTCRPVLLRLIPDKSEIQWARGVTYLGVLCIGYLCYQGVDFSPEVFDVTLPGSGVLHTPEFLPLLESFRRLPTPAVQVELSALTIKVPLLMPADQIRY